MPNIACSVPALNSSPTPAMEQRSATSEGELLGCEETEVQSRPLPFVTADTASSSGESTNFVVHPKACAELEALQGPLMVIAVAGLYRTGKSFILNKLSGQKHGFNVGSRVEPCTHGIFAWVLPHTRKEILARLKKTDSGENNEPAQQEFEGDDHRIVLLDTEGLASFTRSRTHDAKIFALAILLSSYIIYNSIGTIDDTALDRLSFVTELSRVLRVHTESGELERNAKSFFPGFLWLLRDFGLRLEFDGKQITCDEYLENVLRPVIVAQSANPVENEAAASAAESFRARNAIRESIARYFPIRRCFALKRPVNDEKKLQQLASLPDTELRPQFCEQLELLTKLVFGENARTKKINGVTVSGRMLVQMTKSFVAAINAGKVPEVRTAWDIAVEAEAAARVTQFEQECARAVPEISSMLSDSAAVAETQVLSTVFSRIQALVTGFAENTSKACADVPVKRWLEPALRHSFSALKSVIEEHKQRQVNKCEDISASVLQKPEEEGTKECQCEEEDQFIHIHDEIKQRVQEFRAKTGSVVDTHIAGSVLAEYLASVALSSLSRAHRKDLEKKEAQAKEDTAKRAEMLLAELTRTQEQLKETSKNLETALSDATRLSAENSKLVDVIVRFPEVLETAEKPGQPGAAV